MSAYEKLGWGIIAFGVVVGMLGAVTILGEWWTERDRLRRLVWRELDLQYADGDFEMNGHWYGAPAGVLASSAVDPSEAPSKLEPHVRAWMRQKGLQ